MRAAGCAGILFLSGFGMLSMLYEFGDHPSGVPGLYDYWSATLGDAVLLPLTLGSLILVRARMPRCRGDVAMSVAGAVAGVSLGLFTQVLWLSDDQPTLNWTLPEPHRFAFSGYYHGGFLIAVSGLFGFLWTSAIMRSTSARWHGVRLQGAAAPLLTAAAATLGFALCLVADNVGGSDSAATRSTLIAMAVALLLFLGLAWATTRRSRRAGRGGMRLDMGLDDLHNQTRSDASEDE